MPVSLLPTTSITTYTPTYPKLDTDTAAHTLLWKKRIKSHNRTSSLASAESSIARHDRRGSRSSEDGSEDKAAGGITCYLD